MGPGIYRESLGWNVLRALDEQFVEIHLAKSRRVPETARTGMLFRNHIDVRDFDKTLKPLPSNTSCLPTVITKSTINYIHILIYRFTFDIKTASPLVKNAIDFFPPVIAAPYLELHVIFSPTARNTK